MRMGLRTVAALLLTLPAVASTQSTSPYQAPQHTNRNSPLFLVPDQATIRMRADAGMQIEQSRSPAEELAEHRRLTRALAALLPQRAGTVDAYVISIALDSDPVFAREARVAGTVLGARYGAQGRTIVLAGSDGSAPSALPRGTPGTFNIALARVAELMNKTEDVLVVYTTGHGTPYGLYYNDADNGYGAISPNRLHDILNQVGIRNRLLILSACFSGVFVPRMQAENTAIVTAASADRSSFGCVAENDWTFFGDAMINHALRKPQPLRAAFTEANNLITSWESQFPVQPSQPQVDIGAGAERWLAALDRRLPAAASQPVGRPALETSREMMRH
jgi:Peptidase C13 family